MVHTPRLQILDRARNKKLPWEGWKPTQSSKQGSLHRPPCTVNSRRVEELRSRRVNEPENCKSLGCYASRPFDFSTLRLFNSSTSRLLTHAAHSVCGPQSHNECRRRRSGRPQGRRRFGPSPLARRAHGLGSSPLQTRSPPGRPWMPFPKSSVEKGDTRPPG